MSSSKFHMASKLSQVQQELMGTEVPEDFDDLIAIVFNKCNENDLTFWFSIIEDDIILNLRDINHANYELNIRMSMDRYGDASMDKVKRELLTNAFLLTNSSNLKSEEVAPEDKGEIELDIITTDDKTIPPHARNAIDTLNKKGVPVTINSIRNHIPFSQISNDQRIKCNRFLKQLEASLDES